LEAGTKKLEYKPCKSTDIFTFSYTSGTTGTGKACMISHENMLSGVAVVDYYIKIVPEDVYMSYLPLAHMMERLFLNAILRFIII
jgi:long-chain acyl-CoA synthetase